MAFMQIMEITSSRNRVLYEKGKVSYLHDHYLPLKFLNQENSISFTVIRDPLARLISKYKMDFNLIKNNVLRSFPGANLTVKIKDPIDNYIDNPELYFRYLLENEIETFMEFYQLLVQNSILLKLMKIYQKLIMFLNKKT